MPYSERDFQEEDLRKVCKYENQIEEIEYVQGNPIELEIYNSTPKFRTLLYNDEIVCIFGCPYGGYRTYIPALIPGQCMKRHLRRVITFLYKYFLTHIPMDVQRLEAAIDAEDKVALRFAQYFGFDIIGLRHQACVNGHDQVVVERLCSKTKKEAMIYDERFV